MVNKDPYGGPPPQGPHEGPPHDRPPAPPPEKPRRRRRRGRRVFTLLLIVALIALTVGLYLGRGLGFGQGGGSGEQTGAPPPDSPAMTSSQPTPSSQPEGGSPEGDTVTIEVTQSKYLIGGKEVTLDDIEARIQSADLSSTAFRVEDNYGSAKAHDELDALFAQYEIVPIKD